MAKLKSHERRVAPATTQGTKAPAEAGNQNPHSEREGKEELKRYGVVLFAPTTWHDRQRIL